MRRFRILDHHQAALGLALRVGAPAAELESVRSGECDLGAQGKPPIKHSTAGDRRALYIRGRAGKATSSCERRCRPRTPDGRIYAPDRPYNERPAVQLEHLENNVWSHGEKSGESAPNELRHGNFEIWKVIMTAAMDNWYQFIIPDPHLLSGASVQSFLIPIVERLNIKWVFVSDVEGAASVIKRRCDAPILASEFIGLVGHATQYDWAFFFLYSDESLVAKAVEENDKTRIVSANLTIRLADNIFLYVYTKDEDVASYLRIRHPTAEYKTTTFGGLNIPY